MAVLTHLAALVLAWAAVYGTCADDVAALPEAYRPAQAGYTLTCVTEPIWFERTGRWVPAMVSTNDRHVTLNGTEDRWPVGFVLAHEACHIVLDHRPGPGVEAEANVCAAGLLGI